MLFEKSTKQPADNAVMNGYGLPKSKAAVIRAMAIGVP